MIEFVRSFIRDLIESYIRTTLDLLKVEATIVYVNGVKTARRVIILLCLLIFCTIILACGFILIPIALCLYMPWTPETKATVAIIFGAVYVLIPVLVMSGLLSQKRWMKMTGANEMVKKALDKD